MNEILIKYDIISREEFEKISSENIESISDFIEFDSHVLVGLNQEFQENSSNISIGLAAAITSYARIHMTQFKNNPNFNLYYSDTDSIYIDRALPENLVDSKSLGKMKLEYICKEAIFISPKVYCLETEDGIVIKKVKGLKDTTSLEIQDFKDLLIKDNFKIKSHAKWFRNLSEGTITIKEQLYTLIATENKRNFIYKNRKIIGTKAIKLK